MAEDDCFPQVGVCALRIAELDPSGVPQPGAGNLLTVDSLVEVVITPNFTEGDTITQKNGCGTTKLNYESPATLNRYDLQITVLDRNPFVAAALARGEVLTDGGVHGYASPALGTVSDAAVSIEFFAKRIDDGTLAFPNPYAWWVFPKVINLRENPSTKNGTSADNPVFIGQAFENANWFDGPLNDWPVTSDRAYQWFPVGELPTTACEPTALPVS